MDLCANYLGEDVGEDMIDPSFDLSGGHVDMSLSTEADSVEHLSNLEKSVSPMITRSLREGQLAGSLPRGSPMKSVGSLPRNESPVSLARTPSGQHVFQPQTAHTLAQEFSLLNLDNVTHLEIETVSVASSCNQLCVCLKGVFARGHSCGSAANHSHLVHTLCMCMCS